MPKLKFNPKPSKPISPLQKAQREWAWNNVQIKGCISNLQRVSNCLGFVYDLKTLQQKLENRNNAQFIARGGTINAKIARED